MGNKRLQRHIGRWILIGAICLIPVGVWAWGVLGLGGGVPSGATLWFDDGTGFESPWAPKTDPGNWDSYGSGSPVSESVIVKNGSVSMECDATLEYMDVAPAGNYTEVWFDFWVYVDANSGVKSLCRIFDTGGSNNEQVLLLATDEVSIADGTNQYDTGNSITEDQWTHFFVHYIYAAGGSETIQIEINTGDYWTAWDYSTTSATMVPTNANRILFGTVYSTNAEVIYYDGGFKIYYGAGMPSAWTE